MNQHFWYKKCCLINILPQKGDGCNLNLKRCQNFPAFLKGISYEIILTQFRAKAPLFLWRNRDLTVERKVIPTYGGGKMELYILTPNRINGSSGMRMRWALMQRRLLWPVTAPAAL